MYTTICFGFQLISPLKTSISFSERAPVDLPTLVFFLSNTKKLCLRLDLLRIAVNYLGVVETITICVVILQYKLS